MKIIIFSIHNVPATAKSIDLAVIKPAAPGEGRFVLQ